MKRIKETPKVPYTCVYMPNKRSWKIHSKLTAGVTSRTQNGIVESLMVIISSLILKMPSSILPLAFHTGCSFCLGTLFPGVFAWLASSLLGSCSVVPSSEAFTDPHLKQPSPGGKWSGSGWGMERDFIVYRFVPFEFQTKWTYHPFKK